MCVRKVFGKKNLNNLYSDQASTLAKEMQALDVSDAMNKKAGVVLKYIQLRREELAAIVEILVENNAKTLINHLNEIQGT